MLFPENYCTLVALCEGCFHAAQVQLVVFFLLLFFFPRTFFRKRLWFKLFYWTVSRQTRNTKGKNPGPMRMLTKVGEVDWKGVSLPGFPPGFGSSWTD